MAILIFTAQGIILDLVQRGNLLGKRISSVSVSIDDIESFIEECGACHVAYPPGLLPVESWERIMAGLDDHFGDNAELDDTSSEAIKKYLYGNALRMGHPSNVSQMIRNLPETPPLRITELPNFLFDHEDVMLEKRKSELGNVTLSQCDECHENASSGQFH